MWENQEFEGAGLSFLNSSLDSIFIVLRCIFHMQASQALALTVSRVPLMEDVNVQLSNPEALIAALDVAHLSKRMPETPWARGGPRGDTRDLWCRW